MPKTKAKRTSLGKDARWGFVALWTLMFVIGGLVLRAFRLTEPDEYLTSQQVMIASYLLGLTPTLLRVVMIERVFKRSMRGWLVFTMVGTLITFLISPWTLPMTPLAFGNSDVRFFLNIATIVIPPVLLQTLWLWRRVPTAWVWLVWPLLTLVRSTFFIAMSHVTDVFMNAPLEAQGLLHGLDILIQGLVMHHLLSQSKDTEKAKVDFAINENAEYKRIERLQESEHCNPLWDIGDKPALQTESNI